jgi:UDP-N-acetylglucosamine 2-epimerase (non-hydrolysing)
MNRVMVVVGTRPEIIKMAPLIKALRINGLPLTFVHCGQHYDYGMSQQLIEDLELPEPDYQYKLKVFSQGVQTARIMIQMERLLMSAPHSLVLVEGDTNGVLATALVTVKLGIRLGHVEAGLRSHDVRMPEEHNRRLTDHVSSYLFAPTETAESNLEKENVWGNIFLTGNTAIDAVIQNLPKAEMKSRILRSIDFKRYALATAHRAENVDDLSVLRNLMEVFAEAPIPVVYPMHPRTKKRLRQNGMFDKIMRSRNVQVLPPVGYLDFLILMKNCEIVLTDSGGIQEEATAPCIRKPVLVMRVSTERPEAVSAGFAQVVGTRKESVLQKMKTALERPKTLPETSPYGNGNAAEKIVSLIKDGIVS